MALSPCRYGRSFAALAALTFTPLAAAADPTEDRTTAVIVGPVGDQAVIAAVVVEEKEERGRIRGRHRLHIDADIASWRRWTPWREDNLPGTDDDIDGDQAIDSVTLLGGVPMFGRPGLGPSGYFTLGYGYGLSENVILGARLGLGFQHLSTPAADSAATGAFAYSFVPYLEYVFRRGARVRPFLGVRAGVGGSMAASDLADSHVRTSTIGPTFGANLGMHAFVAPRVSLDMALSFDYALVWRRGVVEPRPENVEATAFGRSAMVPNLAATVGISVWLGRNERRSRDRR